MQDDSRNSQAFPSLLSQAASTIVLSPTETLMAHNVVQWFGLAQKSTRFCLLCEAPLDAADPDSYVQEDPRCEVCQSLESTLWKRSYWIDLHNADKAHRRAMGLDVNNA